MTLKDLVACNARLLSIQHNLTVLESFKYSIGKGVHLMPKGGCPSMIPMYFEITNDTRAAILKALDAQIESDLSFLSEQLGCDVTLADVSDSAKLP